MTSSGQDGSRAGGPLGRPGPRWDAGDSPAPESAPGAIEGRAPRSEPPAPPKQEKPPRVLPEDASLTRRLGAWLIDELARTFFYTLLLLVLILIGGWVPEPVTPGEFSLAAVLPQMVLRFGLSWIFWSQGTSPGAMLLKVRLVDAAGNPPGPRRGGIRAAMEIVSISTLLIGFAWALVSRRRQTWHDAAAGVYVVNDTRDQASDGQTRP